MEDTFFNDFLIESNLSLVLVGSKLSQVVFCGIPFEDSDGMLEEVPALLLKEKFMGLEVVLGGYHSTYQLRIITKFDRQWFDYSRIDHGFGDVYQSIYLEKYFADILRGAFLEDDEVRIFDYAEPWLLRNVIE
jgi:hypothetical protein